MDEKRVADYFVVAGLPENPVEIDDYSNEAVLKPTYKQDPITDIAVINKTLSEQCPAKYKCIESTPLGFPADLNHGSIRSPEVYLCYKRGREKPPLTDIGVLYEGKERVKAGCEVVHLTPYGHNANVNNSSSGRIYITFRRTEETAAVDTLAVTDVCIILGNKGEQPPHAFCQIPKNLNKGMVGSDVFLCYKKSMAKTNVLNFTPGVLSRYPAHDYPTFPLPTRVPLFCLPMGASVESWPAKAMHPLPVFSKFVLTVGNAAEKVYGAAVAFYEEYEEEKLSQSHKQQLGILPPECPPGTKTVHHNKCICLLSRWPFFDTFRKFLFYLYRISISGSHMMPIERYISHFIHEIPFPSPQRPRILVQLCQEALSLCQPEESPLPQSGASFITLLKNLGPENCMNLLLYVLMEHKILIHSLRPAVLTSVAEAVATMIFPLHWQCPYIPLCPLGLSDLLSAPTPFILGVDSRYFDMYEPPHDVTCVDLDTNNVSPCEEKKHLSHKFLPKRPSKVLRATLERLYEELCQDMDSNNSPLDVGFEMAPADFAFQKRQREMALDMVIQEAFLRFMASCLKGYKNFLLPIMKAPTAGTTDTSSLFDIQGFLKSRDKAYHKFFNQMMKTQIFTRFIEERSFVSDKDASLAFFDECTEKVDETKDEPRLIEVEDNTQSDRTVYITPPDMTGLPDGASYSYNGFPNLNPDNFPYKPQLTVPAVGVGPGCPNSPMAKRTKQEIKFAQKAAQKHAATPKLWAMCLTGNCYSLWFIHLPAYVKCVHSKTKALRTAYDVLVKMQAAKLQTSDEICYRVLMQLCGQYHQPVLAVKVLFEMRKNGIHPNAITYGYYNKAVLESKWPSSESNAYLMWTKVKNIVMSVAQFKRGLKNRRLSMYSNSSSEYDCISQRSGDSFMEEANIEKSDVVKGGEHIVNDLVSLESPNEEKSSTGGMSDRGYSSMSLEDAKKLSTAVGSQDSLDTEARPSIVKTERKNSAKRNHRSRLGKANDFHQIDPRVDEHFQKKINSIVRVNTDSTENGSRGVPYGSATGLLMTTQMSVMDSVSLSNELTQSLNINRNVPRKPYNSSGEEPKSSILENYLPTDTKHVVNCMDSGGRGDGKPLNLNLASDNGDPLLGRPLNEVSHVPVTYSRDRTGQAMPNLIGSGDTGSKVVTGDIIGAIDKDTESKTTSDMMNSASSTPSHSGSQKSLSPQHSIRTPVTENDPLGLFNLNPELSITVTESSELNDSDKGTPKKSNKYQLLLDLQPFSSSTPAREGHANDSVIEETSVNLDSTTTDSSTDPGKSNEAWSPLPKMHPKVDKAATLPILERSSSTESPFHKHRFLNRTGSFRGAIKSAAGILSNKLYEMKQSYATQSKGENGSSQSLPKPTDAGTMTEEENDDFMRKAESLDELGERLERSQSEDAGASRSALKGYMSFDFLDGSAFLQRLSALQAYALNIPYLQHDMPTGDHEGSSPDTEPVNPEPSPTGVTQPHSVLEHLVPMREVDIPSLSSSNSNLKNSGSLLSIPQRIYDTAVEVEMSSLSRCNGCAALLYDEETMAGWSADDSNLNTTCQFCNSKLVPLLQIYVKDYRHMDRTNLLHSQSCESMHSIHSMPNVPLHHTTGQVNLRKKILAAKSADNILSTANIDLEEDIPVATDNQEQARTGSETFDEGILVNLGPDSPTKEAHADQATDPRPMSGINRLHSGSDSALLDLQDDPLLEEESVKNEDNAQEGKSVEAETQSASSAQSGSTEKSRRSHIEPRISEPIVVPYLSPLVLRKELENVLEQEGDQGLAQSQFVDDHPIIYWNLVWYFKRIDVQSHLPGFVLTARSTNKDPPPRSWAGADSRHVIVRCVWDNLKMHEDLGQPMYLNWCNVEQQSSTVKALVTDHSYSRSVMQHAVSYIRCNDVLSPIKLIMNERRKQKKAPGKSKVRSMYRDLLFLAFVSLGRDNIDHDAFDREYKIAYSALSHRELGRVRVVDRPPTMRVIWCRRMFSELEL